MVFGLILIFVVSLFSCTSTNDALQDTKIKQVQNPSSIPAVTQPSQATNTPIPEKDPEGPEPFPLSERGSYWTGNRVYTLVDPSRSAREIRITIHYPAIIEYNSENNPITRDAVPDLSSAPYPVILTGPDSGDILFKSHLSSQGFVMVIVRPPNFSYDDKWGNIVIDAPRDFLFTLDQLTSSPPDGLAGLMDTDRVGVAGYSWDGFFSLALGGVRIDPENYLFKCAHAPSLEPPLSPSMLDYYCSLSANWDQFTSYAGDLITTSDDGLWQPLSDDRILAVMPMAPDGAWLYGELGLSTVQIPTLIITGTDDDLSSYTMETMFIYKHIGSSEKYLISFINKDHRMVLNSDMQLRMKHFATAFFGYYLKGNEDYKTYFSEDFINKREDLHWGIYNK
jgi:predicted dienelactone hydrolase